MRITMDNGQPIIDAAHLADLLDLTPAQFKEQMRDGEVTSLFEKGVGNDAKTCRLSFFHDGLRVRLTCTEDGHLLRTERTKAAKR